MASGLNGAHGLVVLYAVQVVSEIEQEHAPILNLCMVDRIVQKLINILKLRIARRSLHVQFMASGQNGALGESVVDLVALVGKLEQEHVLILHLSMVDWIVQTLILLFRIAIQSLVRFMATGQIGAYGESAVDHVALACKLEQEHVLILHLSMADWIVQTLVLLFGIAIQSHVRSMANGRDGARGESAVHHVALANKL